MLHSANRTAFDYLGYKFLDRKIESTDEPAAVMTQVLDSCYVLYLSSTDDEWWGWAAARSEAAYLVAPTPAEKRVLDTIRWVIRRYKIDRNRVYLSGISMGGCGALAIGLPHGDIFAAIMVDVPAGTEYAAFRMGFPPPLPAGATEAEKTIWAKRISGAGLPDPPVVLDFSAQNDTWSQTQPALLQAALGGKLPLIVAWAPFGHTAFSTPIAKYHEDEVALSFPWLEIRRNAAYPVFTNASSDRRSPWVGSSTSVDESGQINAYFRWSNRRDEPSKFSMRLWVARPVMSNPPDHIPEASTTDVTFRRLQLFKVEQGKSYAWRLVRGGKILASGRVAPDPGNLLTIPRLELTSTPAELSLKPAM